jgi:hypothetical protein
MPKEHKPMRTSILLAIAAAALATPAAMGARGLGPATSLLGASDREQVPAAVSGHAASGAVEALAVRPTSIAFSRYRAEACSGDYVCREDGAWEPAAGASAAPWPVASDGF